MLVCFDDSNFNLSQFLLFFRQLLKPAQKPNHSIENEVTTSETGKNHIMRVPFTMATNPDGMNATKTFIEQLPGDPSINSLKQPISTTPLQVSGRQAPWNSEFLAVSFTEYGDPIEAQVNLRGVQVLIKLWRLINLEQASESMIDSLRPPELRKEYNFFKESITSIGSAACQKAATLYGLDVSASDLRGIPHSAEISRENPNVVQTKWECLIREQSQ